MNQSRRYFLQTAGAVTLGFAGFRQLSQTFANNLPKAEDIPFGYGDLVRDPNGLIDLPKGFSYTAFSKTGERMSDGLLVPGKHDGMAAFPGPKGKTILVRNHELEPTDDAISPYGVDLKYLVRVTTNHFYDYGRGKVPGLGGTTTLVYDTKKGMLDTHFLSLAGTHRNCAGGPTPWNSWVTCEETTLMKTGMVDKDHGYNFEVPATSKPSFADPVPLIGMGRFRHEAIAVDPNSGAVYETEDVEDGCVYRYLPDTPGELAKGGKLQALGIRDRKSFDTRNFPAAEGQSPPNESLPIGETLETVWIDLDEVESPKDDLRLRAYEKGAARFARGEGMWYGNDAVYFACTSGGQKKLGQIFRYVPSPVEGTPEEENQPGKLELFIEPNDGKLVTNCDNLTVSPWGDLIVCEDGADDAYTNSLVGVTPKGEVYRFGQGHAAVELAGCTFSPDGSTLFFNVQERGWTMAVTGPWQERAKPS
ncbi:MAG: DUF839 domain-containing protein [Candidatus Omnitrophica bacterium]|nr:DUF839 domain-containing protein [Candidatus Omnitrophota bacterium]